MLSDNKKPCNHQQYASIHHIQEGAFRAALIKMSSMFRERNGCAISVRDMESNFPIEHQEERFGPSKPIPSGPKKTSLTAPNPADTSDVTTKQPGAMKVKRFFQIFI